MSDLDQAFEELYAADLDEFIWVRRGFRSSSKTVVTRPRLRL